MAISYGFFNALKQSDGTYDRVYNSEQIGDMFEGLISDGVYESVGDALIVKASSGMTVQVGTGRIVIGDKWLKNDATLNVTLANSHLTLNRWSAIVVRLNVLDRTIEIIEKVGAEATSPIKPTIENSESRKEKCLAYIYVAAGTSQITQANIEDTRANTNVCGFVTGLIKQVDTSELFLQWQTAYEQFYTQMEQWKNQQMSTFNEWFSALTTELKINTYVEKYHKVVETTDEEGVFALDMDGYVYNQYDVFLVNINGIIMMENYDYTLDTSKNPVEMHTRYGVEAGNVVEITILKSIIGFRS